MKRDREPIAKGVAVHYQPQRHLLKDRIILVTGASDGIGREAALTYASDEWVVRLVLGFGAAVRVLEPRELADQVRSAATAALGAYAPAG